MKNRNNSEKENGWQPNIYWFMLFVLSVILAVMVGYGISKFRSDDRTLPAPAPDIIEKRTDDCLAAGDKHDSVIITLKNDNYE